MMFFFCVVSFVKTVIKKVQIQLPRSLSHSLFFLSFCNELLSVLPTKIKCYIWFILDSSEIILPSRLRGV